MPFVTDNEATPLTPAVAPVLASPALPELTLVRLTRSNPPSPLVMTMQVIPHFVSHLRLSCIRAPDTFVAVPDQTWYFSHFIPV